MRLEGGCYCGQVRYVAEGEPMLRAQCHCRECQYISGGSPNMFMAMPPKGFNYSKGRPSSFRAATSKTRYAGVLRRMRYASGHAAAGFACDYFEVGTLDDPSLFGVPQMAIFTVDKQAFHQIPEGLPTFERMPPR